MDAQVHTYIVENLTTAILLLDDRLRIIYANPTAEGMLGLSARRLNGRDVTDVFQCDGASLKDRLYEYLLAGRPYTEREVETTLFGERPTTVNFSVTPIHDRHLTPSAMLEVAQVDRLLRISRDDETLRQQTVARQITNGLAHEIKNPLGGLRGAAQLLQGELASEELKDYTRIIIGEADRLQKLVDRILGPHDRLALRELQIHEVLEHVRLLVSAEAPSDISIVRDYDPSLPFIVGDRDLLIQAVMNIVRNAVQSLRDAGTITLRTRIVRHFTTGRTRYRLAIQADIIDDGPGVPKDLQDRLFYPMVTGRPEGTGLGLSIAQTLINRHQGLIECASQPGNTVFSILLPVTSGPVENRDDG